MQLHDLVEACTIIKRLAWNNGLDISDFEVYVNRRVFHEWKEHEHVARYVPIKGASYGILEGKTPMFVDDEISYAQGYEVGGMACRACTEVKFYNEKAEEYVCPVCEP